MGGGQWPLGTDQYSYTEGCCNLYRRQNSPGTCGHQTTPTHIWIQ